MGMMRPVPYPLTLFGGFSQAGKIGGLSPNGPSDLPHSQQIYYYYRCPLEMSLINDRSYVPGGYSAHSSFLFEIFFLEKFK
jgi:hypothetical protein